MPRRRCDGYRFVDVMEGRKGQVMYYFRRDRRHKRTRLPGKPKSPEFDAAYFSLMAGKAIGPVARQSAKSIGWLIDLYTHSADWASLGVATRDARGGVLRHIKDAVG